MTNRQHTIQGLDDMRVGSAASRAGMSQAAYCASRLRTFEKRNGRPLTPNQLWVLRCCEKLIGLQEAAP